ncbi:hypothetical protein MSAN_01877700 [Mycena sanguinolenta]|uniref:Uncharacterized protein n=1 Tax=Mycena sanguinolenta TaxID=230812 RepID=A0A8H7CSH6_9AGAR|nr:hypothetical protein MSAN_01877700 [Mycena sanguinolenta]
MRNGRGQGTYIRSRERMKTYAAIVLVANVRCISWECSTCAAAMTDRQADMLLIPVKKGGSSRKQDAAIFERRRCRRVQAPASFRLAQPRRRILGPTLTLYLNCSIDEGQLEERVKDINSLPAPPEKLALFASC